MKTKPDDLDQCNKLFDFLQGKLPEGYKIKRKNRPKLTADQAWTVIWYLGNLYWQVPDYIDRCDVCGSIYNTRQEGDTLDYGNLPFSFCESCMAGTEYATKAADKRNPDNH